MQRTVIVYSCDSCGNETAETDIVEVNINDLYEMEMCTDCYEYLVADAQPIKKKAKPKQPSLIDEYHCSCGRVFTTERGYKVHASRLGH